MHHVLRVEQSPRFESWTIYHCIYQTGTDNKIRQPWRCTWGTKSVIKILIEGHPCVNTGSEKSWTSIRIADLNRPPQTKKPRPLSPLYILHCCFRSLQAQQAEFRCQICWNGASVCGVIILTPLRVWQTNVSSYSGAVDAQTGSSYNSHRNINWIRLILSKSKQNVRIFVSFQPTIDALFGVYLWSLYLCD